MSFTIIKGNITSTMIHEFRKIGAMSSSVFHALLFRLTGLALIFGMQVLLARLMGPVNYGDYTVIITVINLLLVVSLFGFDLSVLRFLPVYVAKHQYSSAKKFVAFSYRTIIIIASLCSVGIFIYLITHSRKLNISYSEGLFWALLLLPMLAILYQSASILRAFNKIKTSLMPLYFLFPLLMGGTCYIYFITHNKLTVDAGMMLNLVCTAIICLFVYRRATKVMKDKLPSTEIAQADSRWMTVSGILFITTGLDLLLKQSDILLISHYLGNTQAGYYSVAAKLATLAALGLSVADYVFIPKIAALFENKKLLQLQELVRISTMQVLVITVPVVFGLIITGKWLLGLFGEQFSDSYFPLIILLCGQLINALTGMVGGLMTMTGNQKIFLLFYAAAFIVQLLINTTLIPKIGITGAAIGSSLSLIFLNLLAYNFVKKKLYIKAGWW